MRKPAHSIGLVLLAAGVVAAALFAVRQWNLTRLQPDMVALDYMKAVYARDYDHAWEFISAEDKQVKTREAYLAENTSYAGLEQELAYILAGWIQFTQVKTGIVGDQATITASVRMPNGNQREVYDILQAAERGSQFTTDEQEALPEQMRSLYAAEQIEILEGDMTFSLIRTPGGWRVAMGWDDAILVKHIAEVSSGLDWDFFPLQAEVLALPGETLKATYRVVNRSDQPVTGKAKHIVRPEEYEDFLETIQCFCFIQQTLAPGETMDMTLIFRISFNVPTGVREFESQYVFYPIEAFPED